MIQSWPLGDTTQAMTSMGEIAEQFRTIGVPFFERLSTPLTFVDEYKDLPLDIPYAHEFSRAGCSLLCAGDVAEGRLYIERARNAYQQWADEHIQSGSENPWPRYVRDMDQLLQAVANGTHGALLDLWYHESLATLKLTEG